MGLLIDEKNKIAYVLPHKCGQCTISTFILKCNDIQCNTDYHSDKISTNFDKKYLDYFKKVDHSVEVVSL